MFTALANTFSCAFQSHASECEVLNSVFGMLKEHEDFMYSVSLFFPFLGGSGEGSGCLSNVEALNICRSGFENLHWMK